MAQGNKFTGGGNHKMNTVIKQAQMMQEEMNRVQSELEEKVVETTAGGGKVKVEMKGTKEIVSLKIDPEIVDPDDTEMLEDLVTVAVNDAIRQVEEMMEEGMSSITGGLNIPGLF
ncbi:MAG: YbaB/EbfC family nucleoid-associated protein [Clostridia bacterium]|nr:YbaB/EbfC family nucleoid-associated protein [Clostridia bacterium]